MKVGLLDFARRPHKYEVVSRESFCSSFPDASQTLSLFYIFGLQWMTLRIRTAR